MYVFRKKKLLATSSMYGAMGMDIVYHTMMPYIQQLTHSVVSTNFSDAYCLITAIVSDSNTSRETFFN